MATKTKTKKDEHVVRAPKTLAEVEELIAVIGDCQRLVKGIETRMNDELALIKTTYEAEARPHKLQAEAALEAVVEYCEAHKGELLVGDRKSVKLASGEIGWRTSPPKVTIRKESVVLEALKRLGLHRFIRLGPEEVNKDAVLADPEAVKGVRGISISQSEDLWVKPFSSQIEPVELSRKVS